MVVLLFNAGKQMNQVMNYIEFTLKNKIFVTLNIVTHELTLGKKNNKAYTL